MLIAKPTIDDAVAGIIKAANKLEAVVARSQADAERAVEDMRDATLRERDACAKIERATRIKAKLEELVA